MLLPLPHRAFTPPLAEQKHRPAVRPSLLLLAQFASLLLSCGHIDNTSPVMCCLFTGLIDGSWLSAPGAEIVTVALFTIVKDCE
jgi:hypothetical protein